MSHENVEIVQQLFEATARRDAASVLHLYDPDVEWDTTRHAWFTVLGEGLFQGHDGLRRFFGELYAAFDTLDIEVEELVEMGDHVVSRSTVTARGRTSGIDVEATQNVGVWTVREAKVVRVVWF